MLRDRFFEFLESKWTRTENLMRNLSKMFRMSMQIAKKIQFRLVFVLHNNMILGVRCNFFICFGCYFKLFRARLVVILNDKYLKAVTVVYIVAERYRSTEKYVKRHRKKHTGSRHKKT